MPKAKRSSIAITEANPADLLPNPWNSNHLTADAEKKLEASIARFGFIKPIIVREIEVDAEWHLQIIGGEHRAAAAERKGHATVPVLNLGRIDDARAKEISLVDNARYGADDVGELAKLLKDLGDVEALKSFMPYTDEDVSSIFSASMIDLDELKLDEEFDLKGEGEMPDLKEPSIRVPKTHTIMRFKVTVEDAERIAKLIAAAKRDFGYTASDELTNAGDALAHLLLASDEPDHGA